MNDRLLVTITGPDSPGLTARLVQIVEESQVRLIDIEQVVLHGAFTLCLVIDLDSPRPPGEHVIKDLLFAGKSLGLDVNFEPVQERDAPERHVDLVVTLIARALDAGDVRAVASRLASFNANIERLHRLTDHDLSALEILCSVPTGHDTATLRKAMLDLSTAQGIDVAVQPNDVLRRSKRLVAFDMDSTLIRIEVIDELAREAGVGEKVAEVTRRAMAGEMDFEQSLRERVALLEGLDVQVLHRISENLPLSEGAEPLLRALRKLGLRTALITGGFDISAQALQRRLDIDHVRANVLEIEGGRLTGRVLGEVVDARGKATRLEEIARLEGIPMGQTMAVGDGANDLEMLGRAGLGVAFHAKPRVREAAHTSLTGGLERVLYLLGLRGRELKALLSEP